MHNPKYAVGSITIAIFLDHCEDRLNDKSQVNNSLDFVTIALSTKPNMQRAKERKQRCLLT